MGGRCRAAASAAAGFSPAHVLPCIIDVGTNNRALRDDPLYMGLNQPRLSGPEYYAIVDEVRPGAGCWLCGVCCEVCGGSAVQCGARAGQGRAGQGRAS
jgi:hypothetical protein